MLAALAALGAFFDPAGMTARETMLPEAAARAGWTLDHANSVYEAVFNLAYIVGPGHRRPADHHPRRRQHDVGDRGAFVLSIVGDRGACGSRARAGPTATPCPQGCGRASSRGCAFVWNMKVLRTLAFIDLAATGLYMPMESVLFPKYFTDRNEPAQLGWVLMALSVGGLVGALGYAVHVQVRRSDGR